MLVLMSHHHTPEDLEGVVQRIESFGYSAHVLPGQHSTAIGVTGNQTCEHAEDLQQLPGVDSVMRVSQPYKLAGRQFHREDMTFSVGSATFGPGHFTVMAGPCAVESEAQTLRIAQIVKDAGAHVLRGGAYKPRSSPYSFQGMGLEGLKILAKARAETGLPVVTEAVDPVSLEQVYEYADIIQIGTRNMQNFELLKLVAQLDKPVLLKRGFSATIEEWLLAAEYLMQGPNQRIILCERGLRHYDPTTRNLVDLVAVPTVRELSPLPVAVDPSHGTGRKSLIVPVARAALAIGAQSIIVDVHDRPKEALCDGPQALLPQEFIAMMNSLRTLSQAMDIQFD